MSTASSLSRFIPMAPYVFISEETTKDDLIRYLTDIKQCGYNSFRTGQSPLFLGEGKIDFTVNDLFFDLAERIGLYVFPHFQLPFYQWMAGEPHNIDPERCLFDREFQRLADAYFTAVALRYRDHPKLVGWIGIGEPGEFPEHLADDPFIKEQYIRWLKSQYGSLDELEKAWGFGCRLDYGHETVSQWDGQERWKGQVFEKYRHRRDLARFRTEFLLENLTVGERAIKRADPNHPLITGIHNLFANAAEKTWDFALQASRADGLMSSIHGGWHFFQNSREFFMPLYVQARMTRDFAKGKFAIPYETTGGPNFRSADRGFNMHPGERGQMILCYLAAGLRGAGFWTWNARLTGYEAGEYALTTLQGEPGARARLLGEYARKIDSLSEELLDARPEKWAAVLYSWENEAFCSFDKLTHSESMKKDSGARRRMGAARSLTNANIPWEFVTDREVTEGAEHPVLIAPGMPLVPRSVMSALRKYVAGGGTLIADMPFAIFDEFGRIRTEGRGGEQDGLLGAYLTDVYDTFNEPMLVGGLPVKGCFGELCVTDAEVTARFQDGRPAVVERKLGGGRVVFFAFEVCGRCFAPGETSFEKLLSDAAARDLARSWSCPGVAAFRRNLPGIDHFYLINLSDGEISTELRVFDARYANVRDVMTGEAICIAQNAAGCGMKVNISKGCGRWLRCEKPTEGQ